MFLVFCGNSNWDVLVNFVLIKKKCILKVQHSLTPCNSAPTAKSKISDMEWKGPNHWFWGDPVNFR